MIAGRSTSLALIAVLSAGLLAAQVKAPQGPSGQGKKSPSDVSRVQCETSADPKECNASLDFAMAYKYAASGDAEKAVAAYKQVLESYPNNAEVLQNLALAERDRGDWKASVEWLEKAALADPQDRGNYLLQAGDVCQQFDRNEDALRYFSDAAKEGVATALARMVPILDQKIEVEADPNRRRQLAGVLLSLSNDLRLRHDTDAATAAAAAVIRNTYASQPAVADQALVDWLDLAATSRSLTQAALETLPRETVWPSKGLQELSALVRNHSTVASWWSESAERRHSFAAALEATGDRVVADHRTAQRLYEKAVDLAPVPPEYAFNDWLKSRPIVFLDVTTQLARLYTADRLLDPGDERFHRLEDRLFDLKGGAYESNDLATTQRIHAVLALIYLDRKIPDGTGPRNARYQLERTLAEASLREGKEGVVLPLPQMNRYLSDIYRGNGRKADAASQLINAAQSYLDLDAVGDASSALNQVTAIAEAPADTKARASAIATIVASRRNIAANTVSALPQLPTALDPQFAARQRFKMLADLGANAVKTGDTIAANRFYVQAFDVVKAQKSLSGPGDILRLEQIKGSVKGRISIEPKTNGSSSVKDGKVWRLSSSAAEADVVTWPQELLTAERASRVVLDAPKDVKVVVRHNAVVVESESKELATSAVAKMKASGLGTAVAKTSGAIQAAAQANPNPP